MVAGAASDLYGESLNRRRASNTKKLHFSVTQFMYVTCCNQMTYETYDTW